MPLTQHNAEILEKEMQNVYAIIDNRVQHYIHKKPLTKRTALSDLHDSGSYYADFVKEYHLTEDERKIVLLALAPEIKPELLDYFINLHHAQHKSFSEIGGIATRHFKGFIPTIKTAYFMLGGHEISEQLRYAKLFDKENTLFKKNVLKEIRTDEATPQTGRLLCLSDQALSYILTGKDVHYEYSYDFPASKLETRLDWEDLVLCDTTIHSLKEMYAYIAHGATYLDDVTMSKHIKPGYRALFYGPAGTGKTLTATLIGKKANKDVYRVDLSQLVSKYIGETEKNLEKIFNVAEGRDWILFFDEADALFGKRTQIGNSNDRFANQETAYLLQRIEACKNIIILASNLKGNMDRAFIRRFQSVIYFALPQEEERLQLWQQMLPASFRMDKRIDLQLVAKKFNIAGGSIINIIRYVTLMSMAEHTEVIQPELLLEGIRREYAKEGRTIES